MSVVAGISMFDGLLLAADCRLTLRRPDQTDVYVDNAQKLFVLAPTTALGFAGDVRLASHLLQELFSQIRGRRYRDAVSLSRWLPRFFRSACGRLETRGIRGSVVFMVASVVRGRPNIVEREAVVRVLKQILEGKSAVQRNWVPAFLVEMATGPKGGDSIAISGTSTGMLYVMRSPNFCVESYRPLQFAAVGSGYEAVEAVASYYDFIVAEEPGNVLMETMTFRDAIAGFIRDKQIPDVGGLYPILRVTATGIVGVGMSIEVPHGGTRIELSFDGKVWTQRNLTAGKEIPLLPPWKLRPSHTDSHTFNDLDDAFRDLRAKD